MSTGTFAVGLVACASRKLQRPAPARDLYVSPLFKKASAFAESSCVRWYVLSAKHRLVHPDTVLEPYDQRLSGSRASAANQEWADMVRKQLEDELNGVENITLLALAGEQYRTILRDVPWPYEVPMQGLGIGQQLGWLTRKLAEA
ncbi:DUF6884 domain-containing protein [Arthrobacter sp. Soil764]|uniref:DUF6884 domain-containing protein n=1 Tax=Arthrobacter sp. Soil764 TaxID=1736403 RepID=UPI00070167C3|nr:DUF6884 domain-containing protein [Arthrobacter sp. Soil764]KRE81358.1 hypothetical protein ASG86_12515 [Arthrobacter sp. Soil764]